MRFREFWDGQGRGLEEFEGAADTPHKPSRWTPPKGRDPWLDLYTEEVSSSIIQGLKREGKPNLSKAEEDALLSLLRDDSIVIRPADKGSSFVILDKDDYVSKLAEEMDR